MDIIRSLLTANDKFIYVLLLFIVLDIITGIIKACIDKDLKSSKLREGLLKKLLEVIIVVIGFALDYCMGLEVIGKTCLMFLVGMEGVSILENIGNYIPIPAKLKEILEALRKEGEE